MLMQDVDSYLALRRSLGFRLRNTELSYGASPGPLLQVVRPIS